VHEHAAGDDVALRFGPRRKRRAQVADRQPAMRAVEQIKRRAEQRAAAITARMGSSRASFTTLATAACSKR
jgi:hypothetical protein